MKKLFYSITLVALVGMMVAGLASAATDAVTATVTVQYAAVSLNQSSFSYGSMSTNTASSTVNLWAGAGITATNDGSTAQFDIYGANSTGSGAGWTRPFRGATISQTIGVRPSRPNRRALVCRW